MVACRLWLGLLWGVYLAGTGLVDSPAASGPATGTASTSRSSTTAREVVAERLTAHVRPVEGSVAIATLARGERVWVRGDAGDGWLEVDPPGTTIGWIERAALDLDGEPTARAGGGRDRGGGPGSGPPERARVVVGQAEIRSGRLSSRRPGAPWIEVSRGTTVRLLDCPPIEIGRGPDATLWFAVAPPAGAACFVRADGVAAPPPREVIPEMLAAYLLPADPDGGAKGSATGSLPADVAAEIGRVDAMHRAILVEQPIEQWRFDSVRAGYQTILKRSGDDRAVEEALRVRLATVTRHEQAASAARDFRAALARSRGHDAQVARVQQRLAEIEGARTRTFHAVGYVQSSSRMVNGRKLHSLIGPDGKTIAYLDLPPGLDVESIGSRRVGVRGAVHYNQDLGTQLISVRELEPVGSRR